MTKKEKSVRTYTSQQRREKTRNASAVSVSVSVLVLQSNRPNELLRMIEDFMETKSDWFRFSQKMGFYILSLHCVYLFQSWTSHFSTLSAQTSSDPNSKKKQFSFSRLKCIKISRWHFSSWHQAATIQQKTVFCLLKYKLNILAFTFLK